MSDETEVLDANDRVRAGQPLRSTDGVVVDMAAMRAKRGARDEGIPFPDDRDHGSGGGSDASRVRIVVTTREDEVNAQALDALRPDDRLYVRGNALVRVIASGTSRMPEDTVRDPDSPTIGVVPAEILREHVAARTRFVKMKRTREGAIEEVPVHPPAWTVGAIMQRGEWPGFRHLEGIVEQPVLRADGSVLEAPGYDAASGVLFLDTGATFEPVPAHPSADDVREALAALDDVVHDFCFARPEHKSAWLASLLTPLARYAFRGPAPLFMTDAPTAGTGKGLLTETTIVIATGRAAPLSAFTADDAEMDKRIVSWGAAGRPVVVLDNVSGRFGGDSLCRALTSTTYSGRVLGLNKDWNGPMLTTWYATGNNIALGDDMYRRVAHIRLLSPEEDPSKRSGFRYPRLLDVVRARRGALVRAALTVLRGFCDAGSPDQSLPSYGTFEAWSALVRSAIVWAGWPDPNEAREELRRASDTKASVHRALVASWHELVRDPRFNGAATAKQAIDHACKTDPGPMPHLRAIIEEIGSKDGRPSARHLGYVLRSLKDRVFTTAVGALAIQADGEDRNGTQRWKVTQLTSPASPADTRSGAGYAGNAGYRQAPPRENEPIASHGVGGEYPASPAYPAGGSDQGSFEGWDPDELEEP